MSENIIVLSDLSSNKSFMLKLVTAGLIATVFAFIISMGWHSISNGSIENARPKPTMTESFPRLAPNLTSKFEDVLYPTSQFNSAGIINPTVDRANLSNLKAAIPANLTSKPFGMAQTVPTQTGIPVTVGQPQQGTVPSGVVNNNIAAKPLHEDLNQRLKEYYLTRLNSPIMPSIGTAFYLDEVIAVGYAGDQNGREVLFYSEAAKKTFAAPIGTLFKDGTLISVSDEGVTFKTDAGNKFMSWSRRDTKNVNSNGITIVPESNKPQSSASNK